jgi:hypothetical protein
MDKELIVTLIIIVAFFYLTMFVHRERIDTLESVV